MTMPEGFRTITPHMTIKDASAAIAFYQKAFGAKLLYRCNMEGSDHVLHARMQVGDSVFMLNDEFPEQGALGPHPQRRSPVAVHLYVDDVDALFAQATGAGGVPAFPPQDMFWGDRYAMVVDPFGHSWSIANKVEDVSEAEMAKRAREAFAQGACEE